MKKYKTTGKSLNGKPHAATPSRMSPLYIRCLKRIALVVGVAALGGCKHGEIGQQEAENGAYDYVSKDADSFARDFRKHLDCYVNEVRDVFGDKNLASYFESGGVGFSIRTSKEYKSEYKVVHTDKRTFFSYWAESFCYTGGAHGVTTVAVGTIDVKTGKKLTVADVIPADKRAEALARLRKAVVAKVGGEEELMPLAKEALATPTDNFYVGADGLHFVFNEYEVACHAQGVVEVVIPAYGRPPCR